MDFQHITKTYNQTHKKEGGLNGLRLVEDDRY